MFLNNVVCTLLDLVLFFVCVGKHESKVYKYSHKNGEVKTMFEMKMWPFK